MKIVLFLAFATALAVACCDDKIVTVNRDAEIPCITASMNQLLSDDATKVDFKDAAANDYSVVWKIGDRIKVFNIAGKTNYVVFKVASIDASGRASFVVDNEFKAMRIFEKPGGDADTAFVACNDFSVFDPSTDLYYAHYGSMESEECGYLTEEMNVRTCRVTDSYLKPGIINAEYHNCIAKAVKGADGKLDFNFKPTLCYFMVTMPGEGAMLPGKLTLTGGNGNQKSSGLMDFSFDDSGNLVNVNKTEGDKSANYFPGTDGSGLADKTFEAGKTYYLPVMVYKTDSSAYGPEGLKVVYDGMEKTYPSDPVRNATGYATVYDLGDLPEPTFKVLYWNIQNGMWADQHNNYDKFVEWVKNIDPDICIWAEASSIYQDRSSTAAKTADRYLPNKGSSNNTNTGWKELAARYGHKYCSLGGKRDNYPQEVTSKYPVITLQRITNAASAGPISHGSAVHQISVGKSIIRIVTVHTWPQGYKYGINTSDAEAIQQSKAAHEGDAYRKYEVEWLCKNTIYHSNYADGNTLWIMAGDFNSPSRKDNKFLGLAEDDPWLDAMDYIYEETDMVDVIKSAYPDSLVLSTAVGRRVDYVLTSPDMYKKVTRAETIVDEWTAATKSEYVPSFYTPSDHLPILVYFKY